MKMTRRDFLRLSSAAAAACGVTLLPAQKADAASAIQTLLEEAYLYACLLYTSHLVDLRVEEIALKGIDAMVDFYHSIGMPASFHEPVSYTHLDVYKRQVMSLVATVLFKEPSFGTWVHTFGCNFPMALCWQMFYCGPLSLSLIHISPAAVWHGAAAARPL